MKKIQLPKWTNDFFKPARYKVAYGGRGSGKSYNIATMLLILATQNKLRILCTREFQISIKDSVHKLLSDRIKELELTNKFKITDKDIKAINGSEFIFKGLHNSIDEIKSMEGINICWIEEAANVSNKSYEVLIPTIRALNSEIWISFNPNLQTDATYKRFILNPPENAIIKQINWRQNPFFNKTLNLERLALKKVDMDLYNHVWEGQPRISSKAQVMHGKWEIKALHEDLLKNKIPYFGLDFGFIDPTALIKCYILDNRFLYISNEFYGAGYDINDLPRKFLEISGSDTYKIVCDNARPELIEFLRKKGFYTQASKKGKNSIKDGIALIRSFERIFINPNCKNTIREFGLYSYKVDSLSNEITPEIIDKDNHTIDAIRYALERFLKPNMMHFTLKANI